MWRTDSVRAVLVGTFALWTVSGHPPIFALILVAFLLGSAQTVFDNSSTAFLPEIVTPDRLDTANGRFQGSQLVGLQLIGPPLGAALFAVAGGMPLLADAASFAVAALLVWSIRRPRSVPGGAGKSVLGDIAEGMRRLWRQKGLRVLAVLVGTSNLGTQMGAAILVLLVVNTLHAPEFYYGLVLAAGAVGGLLASAVAGRLRKLFALRVNFALSIGLLAVALAAIGLAQSVWVVAAMYGLGSFGIVVWNVQAVSVRQRLVPRALMGRVTSVYRLVGWGAGPIGALLGGQLASAVGIRAPFLIGGGVMALSLVLIPRLSALETATR